MLCTFEEWKENARATVPDDGRKERWSSCFTSRTRVLPTLDWSLATVRQNAKRGLGKKFPNSPVTMALIQVFVGVLSTVYSSQLMFTSPGSRLTVDDLNFGKEYLDQLVVGDLDRWRSSGFLG